MTVELRNVPPLEIEGESFRIIDGEFGPSELDESTYTVIRRVIHATGDFAFKDTMRFSPDAIAAGVKAIQSGKNILTDVTMVSAGISKQLLGKWGGRVICRVAEPEIARQAKTEGRTRSEVAIDTALDETVGIVAIGNAPTALVQTLRCLAGRHFQPAPLIVGVPVGFVNAAESKALLVEENNCYITSLGRKGGSPVAAAIVNALLRLAER